MNINTYELMDCIFLFPELYLHRHYIQYYYNIFIAANERKVEKEKNEKVKTQEKTKQKVISIFTYYVIFIHSHTLALKPSFPYTWEINKK